MDNTRNDFLLDEKEIFKPILISEIISNNEKRGEMYRDVRWQIMSVILHSNLTLSEAKTILEEVEKAIERRCMQVSIGYLFKIQD